MMEKGIVLITGATSGIGRACAFKFAENGFRLVLNGRNEKELSDLKSDIESKCGETGIFTLLFDVRNREEIKNALNSLPEGWKDIDVLINNAGLVFGLDKEYEGDPAEWDVIVDTNIKGVLYMTRLIVPGMVKRRRGHIVNIGSVAGDAAYAGGSVYCATKAAVKALSDGLRIDLVDTPVKVTDIKPGLVETNFSLTRFRGDRERAANVYKGIKPLRGEDVAESVFFAVSAPEHVQIAEILVLATHQASGTVIYRQ